MKFTTRLVLAILSTSMTSGCPAEPEPSPEPAADAGPLDNEGGRPPFVVVDAGTVDAGNIIEPCVDDAAEDDDTQATARPLAAGATATARVCGDDDDWFAVDVPGNDCTLIANLALVPNAEGVLDALSDLDLLLTNTAGQVVGVGVGAGAREGINVRVAAGRHAVRVRGTSTEDVDYTLTADVVCAADAVCPADDADEDNDAADTATVLERNLARTAAVCGSDVDFFALPASDCMTDVEVSFTHSRGDIDLELHDGDPTTAIASSAGTSNRERLTRLVSDSATARVLLFNGTDANTGNGYRIVVDEVCAAEQACPGDDVFEDNDTRQTAHKLESNSAILATICGADEDFFRTTLRTGCTTTFAADFSHAAGDIDVQLLSNAGAVLASAVSSDDDEQLSHTATANGEVVLRVFGIGGVTNAYQLNLTTTCP
jgi:hypothetical protein